MKLRDIAMITAVSLFSQSAHALTVDNMFLISDEHGNGVYTLNNNADYPVFINTHIDEITVDKKGLVVETAFDKDNVETWSVALTHPKIILEKGRTKEVGVRTLCGNTCSSDRDQMYKITFSPSVYTLDDDKNYPAVMIHYGYAPVFVIPAKESNVSYNIHFDGTELEFENNSNTMLRVYANECETALDYECQLLTALIAGRKKTLMLPSKLQGKTLTFKVGNHNESFLREITLKRGEYASY